ncbi:MAG: MerR family transcriptional regulator [Gemmatimonadales bacterium]
MTDAPLYTLRDIARELDLPESTVRYYRDAFAHHIHTVGSGRRRRYPAEAVATLRLIALWYGEGKGREEIERELSNSPPTEIHEPHPSREFAAKGSRDSRAAYDELLSTVLDGERERREAIWQMAREMVRLGEALDRQQALLTDIAERVQALGERALPAGEPVAPADRPRPYQTPPRPPPAPAPPAQRAASPPTYNALATDDAADLMGELETLKEELAHERALVERLRRSKLEIERRAAEAEERATRQPSRGQRRSMLGRLLSKEDDLAE